jgi:hypothetical protein
VTKPAPDPTPHFKIECPCGWHEVFTRGYSGLEIECARCGRRHRIPIVGAADNDADNDARLVMEKLMPARLPDKAHPEAAASTVRLKPLFALSAVACGLATVAAWALFRDKPWPMAVVLVGGAASWPLGLFVAWLGQRAGRKSRGAS